MKASNLNSTACASAPLFETTSSSYASIPNENGEDGEENEDDIDNEYFEAPETQNKFKIFRGFYLFV